MGKVYIFNFDGTSNSPEDAVQELDRQGNLEDESITNILKFHLLCGGSLASQGTGWDESTQKSYYYAGIGSYGSALQKSINAIFSPEGSDVANIINRAMDDFDNLSGTFNQDEDAILVTGFSRGAALARRFAKLISDKISAQCIYEAVFDTVASINKPNLRKSERPKSEVVFEDHSLPKHVKKALHLVSLDEKRSAFQPTLMNKEEKVTEVWFPGAHSDVGGGYGKDGLSDVSMRFFLDWIYDLDIGVLVKRSGDVDYHNILPAKAAYDIGQDDVVINPNPLGRSHEQERFLLVRLLTLTDRLCCVLQNDKVVDSHKPLVHHSVAIRIYQDSDYRPKSLKNIEHKLLYQDGETVDIKGIQPHTELPAQNIAVLKEGESKTVTIFAAEKYNRTGLYLEAGKKYKFEVSEQEKWFDKDIKCDAKGWGREDVKLGIKELAIASMEPFRRVPNANWFELCASVGKEDKECFRIGLECIFAPQASGELLPFANDLERFYGNNQGKIRCVVTCLG